MKRARMAPDLSFERRARFAPVCGVDEAGRGPWAGPVVAAAVILDPADLPPDLDDSKRLVRARREAAFAEIAVRAVVGVGIAEVAEIDRLNILQASLLAMVRAVAALPLRPAHALIDGDRAPDIDCGTECVVGGDGLCLSIAAASIVAKVTRDRIMCGLSATYPEYGWETNAGYGVPAHRAALTAFGPTPHHRRSFRPIHNMLCEENSSKC